MFRALFLALAMSAFTAPAQAATMYISDELTVPLRSGPSSGHRILHRGLPSGTKLETLSVDEAAGFTQIRTERGTEGWIRTQYLVSEPIAKLRLAGAQAEAARARRELTAAQERIRELTSTTQQQSSANDRGQARIAALEEELAELKRISADAIETHESNLQLTEANVRLRDELDDLAETRARLEDNATNQALMIGGGLLLIGLIVGAVIKARPQRSAWN